MQVIVLPTGVSIGCLCADLVLDALGHRPDPVLGLATGSSPLPLYAELARRVASGELGLRHVRAFALDEYVGLSTGHPQSYAEVIRRAAVEPLGLDPALVRTPDGSGASLQELETAAAAYERAIASAGGVDIQIGGIGTDGHIGFNEPMSSLRSRTRVKALTAQTREDNARFFDSVDDVPAFCVTQGLGTILDARAVLIMAQGESKAAAVAAAIEGPLSAAVPASVLQLHERATFVLDEAAASQLAHREYYALSAAHSA